ncbi:HAD-like domain-containing protein [Circinella umbellata]|nr:HAD-like domain-containing protein [Circinella umbellata]
MTRATTTTKYHENRLESIRQKKGYIIDLDGVIYHGSSLLPGAKELIDFLQNNNKQFLFLTNDSATTPKDLQQNLSQHGIDISESHFYTSGQATAEFLHSQMPEGGSCFVIGEDALIKTLNEKGFTMNDQNPDYVILGTSTSPDIYSYEQLTKAIQLVLYQGAKLIATHLDIENYDTQGKKLPSCGAFASFVETVTKTKAFYCGKPSALTMRYAQRLLGKGIRSHEICIIGDRMETDIIAGINSKIDSVLVLSGVTTVKDVDQHAFQPYLILNGVYEIVPSLSTTNTEEKN